MLDNRRRSTSATLHAVGLVAFIAQTATVTSHPADVFVAVRVAFADFAGLVDEPAIALDATLGRTLAPVDVGGCGTIGGHVVEQTTYTNTGTHTHSKPKAVLFSTRRLAQIKGRRPSADPELKRKT